MQNSVEKAVDSRDSLASWLSKSERKETTTTPAKQGFCSLLRSLLRHDIFMMLCLPSWYRRSMPLSALLSCLCVAFSKTSGFPSCALRRVEERHGARRWQERNPSCCPL